MRRTTPRHAEWRRAVRRVLSAAAACLLAACAGARPQPDACPRALPELLDLTRLQPPPQVDIRYATADNFTGRELPGYRDARALLRPEAAGSLARVEQRLRARGLGLKVWDAYRPVRATIAMVEWAERSGNLWVLEQGYVARESGHNRGATVDLTLIDLESGDELDLGTAYDDFSERAHTANATGDAARNRETLVRAMAAEGWRNYAKEWWHFTYTAGEYAPLDVPLRCF